MRTLHAQTVKPLPVSAKRLVKLERSGRYEDALEMFGANWQNDGFLPDILDLTAADSAEVMLRFGSLIGFYGFKRRIEGAQERSKNLLTAARESFGDLLNPAKMAECENHIALAYWRMGEYLEANVWIEEALAHDLPNFIDARLYAFVTKSLIFLSERRYHENIANCLAVEDDMRRYGDAFLNGSICTNLGLSFKNVGQNAEAMRYLTLARFFHEKSRHKTYLGTVQNNLAQLHKAERRFETAHSAADDAIRLYKQIRDKTREASTIDTKAQIFLAERKFAEALAAADRSIAMLRKSESFATLAESLATKSKILLFMGDFSDAVLNLIEAVDITRVRASEAAARLIIDDFGAALEEKNLPAAVTQAVATDDLELLMPPSIAHYTDYKGVWINTSHLESTGVLRGSLAIVVPGAVERGDLVAIAELESELVICGFYDSAFGIVCLERGDDDPQLFNEEEIRVLGKIVGVCNAGKGADGKMIVEAIGH